MITQKLNRWRLILGAESQKRLDGFGGTELSQEEMLMDNALNAIYNDSNDTSSNGGGLTAGNGKSNPSIVKWLGDIRSLFDKELVVIIQNDAIERKGLKQLMFEPEILEQMEPDINLASAIMMLKDNIPKRSKESVRVFISKIVEAINKMLENDIRQSVVAALNKRNHSRMVPNLN